MRAAFQESKALQSKFLPSKTQSVLYAHAWGDRVFLDSWDNSQHILLIQHSKMIPRTHKRYSDDKTGKTLVKFTDTFVNLVWCCRFSPILCMP